MNRFLLILKVITLLSLGPIVVFGSMRGELKGAIWSCPYPLPFIMCNSCLTFCTFGFIRFGLFYGILGGNLIMGRAFCGFFCPGGAAQDLIYKLPMKKLTLPKRIEGGLRYLRYLIAFIIILLVLEATGIWQGIPLVSSSWSWLVQHDSGVSTILITIISFSLLLAVVIGRPFCRYLCPLGTWISPFNRYSVMELKYDDGKCVQRPQCHQCSENCPAGIEPTGRGWNSPECNRCLNCYAECGTKSFSFRLKGIE